MPRRTTGSTLEREIEWASAAFLESRLRERATFDWAAKLDGSRLAERNAIREILYYRSPDLEEPFRSAWFWVCEAWDEPALRDEVQEEMMDSIGRGVDPLAFVATIADLVRPRLSVNPVREHRRRRGAKSVLDLIAPKLAAGRLVSLADLGLGNVENLVFLKHLAARLDYDLLNGLVRAERIGGAAPQLANWIARVYPKLLPDGSGDFNDPDQFREGFCPVVKLLFEVTDRLRMLDLGAARAHAQGWRQRKHAIFLRLWAAAARDPQLASTADVSEFLRELDDRQFWSLGEYPEIAELRGLRFAELDSVDRAAIEARVLRLPPARSFFRTRSQDERVVARNNWARRELNRMAINGGQFGRETRGWIADFDVQNAARTPLTSVTSDIDNEYNITWATQTGEISTGNIGDLLPRLERDLGGDDDRDKRSALQTVRARCDDILAAFAASPRGAYPKVLGVLAGFESDRGRTPRPTDTGSTDENAQALLTAASLIPAGKLSSGFRNFADWLDVWAKRLRDDPRLWKLWISLWPAAVTLANTPPIVIVEKVAGFLGSGLIAAQARI